MSGFSLQSIAIITSGSLMIRLEHQSIVIVVLENGQLLSSSGVSVLSDRTISSYVSKNSFCFYNIPCFILSMA